jgi:hypothetical protein
MKDGRRNSQTHKKETGRKDKKKRENGVSKYERNKQTREVKEEMVGERREGRKEK